MLNPYSLYLVTDTSLMGEKNFEEVISTAIRHGVTAVQIREKEMPTKDFVELGRRVKSILEGTSIPLIVNDRIDVALAIDADGVHIGQNDLSYADARQILGAEKIIGLTVETLEQAQEANQHSVDYLGLSSIFSTMTKSDATANWSKEDVRNVKEFSKHPLIGIGGLNLGNLTEVLSWGLDGVAVVSAICSASNLQQVTVQTKSLRRAIEAYSEKE